jgi:general secretion pathway protein D
LTGTLVLFCPRFADGLHRHRRPVDRRQSQGSPRPGHRRQDRSIDLLPRQTRRPAPRHQAAERLAPAIYLSDGTTPQARADRARRRGRRGYDLNFENAPVAAVAKVILGDVLNVGYTIDPRVQGTVTLASVRPIAKRTRCMCSKMRCGCPAWRWCAIAAAYRLMPRRSRPGGIDRTRSAEAGQGISVVPLRYVSAQTVFKLLDAFGVKADHRVPTTAATR